MQQKACPTCGAAAPLLAPACATCGHQFRTQFGNRTQMISPGAVPTQQIGAPTQDATEQTVAVVWTSVGLFLSALFLFAALRLLRVQVVNGNNDASAFTFLWLLGAGFALSFLTLRLRRLYVWGGVPQEIGERKARFGMFAALLLGALLVGAFVWPLNTEPTPLHRGPRPPVTHNWPE